MRRRYQDAALAPLPHLQADLIDQHERADDVGVDHSQPLGIVLVQEAVPEAAPCIGEEQIDRSPRFGDLGVELFDPETGGDVFDALAVGMDERVPCLELIGGVHSDADSVLREGDFGGVLILGQHAAGVGEVLVDVLGLDQLLQGLPSTFACDDLIASFLVAPDIEPLPEPMGADAGRAFIEPILLSDAADIGWGGHQQVERDGDELAVRSVVTMRVLQRLHLPDAERGTSVRR